MPARATCPRDRSDGSLPRSIEADLIDPFPCVGATRRRSVRHPFRAGSCVVSGADQKALTSLLDRLMKPGLQCLAWRQHGQVFGHMDAAAVEFEQFDLHPPLARDEGEAGAQLQQELLYFAQDGVFEVALPVTVVELQEVEQVGGLLAADPATAGPADARSAGRDGWFPRVCARWPSARTAWTACVPAVGARSRVPGGRARCRTRV